MTRVLIVDDHPVFRDGLAGLLATVPEVEVVGAVGTAEEALAAVRQAAPDVVLMDINLPGASGVEATRQTTQISPATAVLVISMVDDDDSVFAAMAAGARGYVLKGASAAEITAALRTVASGGAVFGAGVASRLLARTPARPSAPARPDDLTAREREVLDLLAEGASNRQIARALGLCFPPIILALAIAAALGIGTTNTIIAMLVVWWPKFARLAHSLVLVQRSQEYVEAAVVIGLKPVRILARHIIPNAVGPLIVLVTLDLGNAIITFAGLSFLGLGVVPPTPEWGSMVAEGRELVEQWWVAAFPGFAILSVVLGFNFVGDGVRDWLDPRARQR